MSSGGAPRGDAGSNPELMRDSSRGIYVASQEHLLQPTEDNPMPTAVPPPIAAHSGTLGVRHVFMMMGLPERGKPFIARRLEAYLSFFHGAETKLFDLTEYQTKPGLSLIHI